MELFVSVIKTQRRKRHAFSVKDDVRENVVYDSLEEPDRHIVLNSRKTRKGYSNLLRYQPTYLAVLVVPHVKYEEVNQELPTPIFELGNELKAQGCLLKAVWMR